MSFFRRFIGRGDRQEVQQPAKDEPVSIPGRDEGVALAEGTGDVPERLEVPEVVGGGLDPSQLLDQDAGQSWAGLDDLPQGESWSPLAFLDDLPQDQGGRLPFEDQLAFPDGSPQDQGGMLPFRDESGWTRDTDGEAGGYFGKDEWIFEPDDADAGVHSGDTFYDQWYAWSYAASGAYDAGDPATGSVYGDIGRMYHSLGDITGEPDITFPDVEVEPYIITAGEEDEDETESQYGDEDEDDDSDDGERQSQSTTTPAPETETPGTGEGETPLVDPGGNVIDPNIHGGDIDPAPELEKVGGLGVSPTGGLAVGGDIDPAPELEEGEATVIDPSTLPGFGHTDPADEDQGGDEPTTLLPPGGQAGPSATLLSDEGVEADEPELSDLSDEEPDLEGGDDLL